MGYGNLAKMAQQMQAEMARAEVELQALRVEGSAGGGAVRATVTGKLDLVSIAISPERRTDSNWLSGVRFTSPCAVARIIESRSKVETATTAVTRSSGSTSTRFTTGMPRAVRLASGTS